MSTQSILKSVNIKSPHKTRQLVSALEKSKSSSHKEVVMSREVRTLTCEQIAQIFGKSK